MTAHPLPHRRARAAAAVILVGALGVTTAACGGGSSTPKTTSKTPSSQSSQKGKTLAAVWPLTGLPLSGSEPNRPVVAVKIPNTAEANPQEGLGAADMITEELVEGGITRLAVFFYSKVPVLAGPVRSMRASDIGIVRPLHATIVSSGAAPPTLQRLTQAKIPFFTGGPGYYRASNRIAPYNLMVQLRQLVRTLKKPTAAPANYLQWGKESDFTGSTAAKSIAVRFSGSRTTLWSYRAGHYVNTNSFSPLNNSFKPDTVLVMRVKEGNAGYLDPAGNPVPETILRGKGSVLVFHDGKVERGIWHKKDKNSPIELTTAAGKQIKVPAGHVFTELDPIDSAGGHLSWTAR